MAFFEVKNIYKTYAQHQALQDVSIEVKQGSVFGLLGPNGAGKTSLIRIINQITAPDSGQVLFDGRPLQRKDIQRIGYLPEERGLYKKMKVGEQAVYLAQLKGLSKADAIKKLKFWFEKFDIGAWWNKKVEELSKGMQQKVQFIVTILHDPELLIFDEPFSGFDPVNANLLKSEILEQKAKGTTIIFSTHNMASVEEICEDIALINASKKVLGGPIEEVKKQFKSDEYRLTFNGSINGMEMSLRHQYQIIENTTAADKTHIRLKVTDPSISTNNLIASVLPLGQLVAFEEVIPSMNDIFIKVVQKPQTENHE
ncbi:MAG: ATP-binding cassette domain-containing protein [Bacteroidales bacterium]|nr:ATP-binding cassette domain-containing protein [Bacteroidales bacterium]